MTKLCDQRQDLDLLQQLISGVRPFSVKKPKLPEFPREEYKKKILAKKMMALAKHKERIRDGLKGDDGLFPSKGVKLNPVEELDQLLRYRQQLFAKTTQAKEEALDKLINKQESPAATYEKFCSIYKSLTASPVAATSTHNSVLNHIVPPSQI